MVQIVYLLNEGKKKKKPKKKKKKLLLINLTSFLPLHCKYNYTTYNS